MRTPDDYNNSMKSELQGFSVAYVYNGDQPVLCSHIGDQPLFYNDVEEIDFDAENALEESGDLLLSLTQEAIAARISERNVEKQAFLNQFNLSIEGVFAQNITSFGQNRKALSLEDIISFAKNSRLATALYNDVQQSVDIKLCDETMDAQYDRATRTVYIPRSTTVGQGFLNFVEGVRQAYHHLNGALIHPLHFQPEDAVVINRVQKADLDIIKIRTAWECHLSGESKAWEAILSSHLSDMAYTLVQEIKNDFRSLNNGWAMQHLFEKWFIMDVCKIEDRKLIQAMLADHADMVFDSDDISKMISFDVINKIGVLPMGKNYLSGISGGLLDDPIFTEIRDRSSANFLWFVKFETAFKEKESDAKASQTYENGVKHKLFSDAPVQPAEIIAFPKIKRDVTCNETVSTKQISGAVIKLFDA
jgi:hypothetical protein